jgi:SAM-dependent methyltransferase
MTNLHPETVEGFGYEWMKFDQSHADPDENQRLFDEYFRIFPWESLPAVARGFDLGCGSGRWARLAAERAALVVCFDASRNALDVARKNAEGCPAVLASAGALPVRRASMDFGYSLGVLHHVPEPLRGLTDAVETLKPGAPFLVFLYYALDNRPSWFRAVWRTSDVVRRLLSRRLSWVRYTVSQLLAVLVYLPMARLAAFLERRGRDVHGIPLSVYRNRSFYVMRTDALDRFGTVLEHRFTRQEMRALMEDAGLERVSFSEQAPYWCAIGFKP